LPYAGSFSIGSAVASVTLERQSLPVSMHNCLFHQLILATMVAAGTAVAAPVPNPTELSRQREQFPLVWEAAKRGPDDAWRRLAPGLESYPLYPYLELAALQRRMPKLQRADVEKFIAAWPDSLPARTLQEGFLIELARRKDWKSFSQLAGDAPRGSELRCDAVQARIALGKPVRFADEVQPLWESPTALPDACDGVVHWAREHHHLTDAVVWKRVVLAARAGSAGLASALAALLDGDDRAAAERAALAAGDPAKALAAAETWPDGPRTREAVAIAFERLARRNSELAETLWAKLETRFKLDDDQRGRVLRALATYRATSYSDDAAARLEALPPELADDTTREWRVRVALAGGDFAATLRALDALSAEQKADPRWRYLRARTLVKLDRENAAMPLFDALASEANFQGFLAADWIAQPYSICPSHDPQDSARDEAARRDPNLQRAFEFFALDRLAEARREWDFGLSGMSRDERRAAADLANALGWYDRAVYTLNTGEDLREYELRFPIVRREQIVRSARAAEIDPTWAYGIIRAESAWTFDAHSAANAWGLMQLLPGTAAQQAKAIKLRYGGTRDLLDPDTNITARWRSATTAARGWPAPRTTPASTRSGAGSRRAASSNRTSSSRRSRTARRANTCRACSPSA
jgi:soluble lytic murein transglycosylase